MSNNMNDAGSPPEEARDRDEFQVSSSTELFSFKKTITRNDHFDDAYKRRDSESKSGSAGTASLSNDSSARRGSNSGSFGAISGKNIWNRLLASDSVWDSLNVTPNDDEDILRQDAFYEERSRPSGGAILCLTGWYELRHFLKTLGANPRMIVASLAAAALVAGLGAWAIVSERDSYVNERMATATFVATESATYFQNEFKRAFVPLYSLRSAVQHSGYFDELATKIGRYPNLKGGEDVEVPGGLANLRDIGGICDDEEVLQNWEDLLDASTRENDLEGLIVRYRLMPKNVACLEYKKGKAMMDSGMDMSNSKHPFWTMVTEDLFVKVWKGLHVFGPFMAGDMEIFCTHLAIWSKDPNARDWVGNGGISLEEIKDDFIDVHGTEVEAWGFVMNYLNWGELKKRSGIYERFADVDMDFYLTRREEDIDPNLSGPKGEPTKQFAHLASSENSHLLDDSNSIVIETESLHGIWENRVGITSANGWNPTWYLPAVVCVAIVSVLVGLLTALTLVKSQLHRDLVKSMVPTKAIKKLQRDQTVIEKFNLITVFYADIVDFTCAAKTMNSTQVMNILNDLFCELDKIADRHGVYKVATEGNRYMVVGGAINPESARVAATRVALFALDAMACVDNKFSTKSGERLSIRAGIASNPSVAGCVGKSNPRYCFFGDAVDAASKMERTSAKMKIQCSEVTYRLLKDSNMEFALTKRADEEANGGVAEDTYWVEKASPCAECFKLTRGSYVLDPCGHILCAACNDKFNLNVCPTCRCKVSERVLWTGKSHDDVQDDESENGSCIFQTEY